MALGRSPSFYGYISTSEEAQFVLEATEKGVCQVYRTQPDKRLQRVIAPGQGFVYEISDVLKKWRDGYNWSHSYCRRTIDDIQVVSYKQVETIEKTVDGNRVVLKKLTDSPLCKKSISVKGYPRHRIICYYEENLNHYTTPIQLVQPRQPLRNVSNNLTLKGTHNDDESTNWTPSRGTSRMGSLMEAVALDTKMHINSDHSLDGSKFQESLEHTPSTLPFPPRTSSDFDIAELLVSMQNSVPSPQIAPARPVRFFYGTLGPEGKTQVSKIHPYSYVPHPLRSQQHMGEAFDHDNGLSINSERGRHSGKEMDYTSTPQRYKRKSNGSLLPCPVPHPSLAYPTNAERSTNPQQSPITNNCPRQAHAPPAAQNDVSPYRPVFASTPPRARPTPCTDQSPYLTPREDRLGTRQPVQFTTPTQSRRTESHNPMAYPMSRPKDHPPPLKAHKYDPGTTPRYTKADQRDPHLETSGFKAPLPYYVMHHYTPPPSTYPRPSRPTLGSYYPAQQWHQYQQQVIASTTQPTDNTIPRSPDHGNHNNNNSNESGLDYCTSNHNGVAGEEAKQGVNQ